MPSLRVRHRALTIATRGILSGVAITIATHGLIQLPQPDIEIPVAIVEAPLRAAGGTTRIEYIAFPQRKRHLASAKLILDSETFAKLSQHQPLDITKLEPTMLRGFFDSKGELHIIGEGEWRHFDQQQDDEEILILMAFNLFWGDDNA